MFDVFLITQNFRSLINAQINYVKQLSIKQLLLCITTLIEPEGYALLNVGLWKILLRYLKASYESLFWGKCF